MHTLTDLAPQHTCKALHGILQTVNADVTQDYSNNIFLKETHLELGLEIRLVI